MSADFEITKHAYDRLKERLGWNKKASNRMIPIVLKDGNTHKESTGRLKKYLDYIFMSHKSANNMRIYGEHLFLFKNRKLITVLSLHNIYKGYFD